MKKSLKDIDVNNKRVIVRVDFNAPIAQGKVTDDTRLRAALPTIQYLIRNKAKIILISHLGRPNGTYSPEYSLAPVAKKLSRLIGRNVELCPEVVGPKAKKAVEDLKQGDLLLLENVRFYKEENENDPKFAKEIASLGDFFVNDAFGAAHREHASVVGIPQYLPAVAGLLLERELNALNILLESPAKPFVSILGGNKISDKIGVINNFITKVDALLIGGGMCFTFLKAQGISIGNSIYEENQIDNAKTILEMAESNEIELEIPIDIVVAPDTSPTSAFRIVDVTSIPEGWMGLDIGPRTIKRFTDVISKAKTVFWNGPLGLFEIDQYSFGTRKIAQAITKSGATSIVGGGDTDAALRKFDMLDKITHVSTGGGASLKVLEGRKLPGVEVLNSV